ncbi:acyl-CoA synthetase [Amylibacter marinus]|uniref:Acyl-CoA synthetase n=1 Tax=Amylibacter marinus TaxID=1475483 RepID=A0ABQ5VTM2_9RHOB|nr:acyl-CoA synthetase [Amylibacter marinus]GLQ34680.1 acyl-CoA synthetase [Amylibacter marinus]
MTYQFRNTQDVKKIEEGTSVAEIVSVKTPYQQLLETKNNFPERGAVSFQLKSGPKDKAQTLSWKSLTQQVTKAANLFRALGVGENDVVAYLLPTTTETLVTLMGGMTAGKVAPINPTLEPEHISALLRETGAKVLVTMRSFPKTNVAELAHAAAAEAPSVETVVEVDLLEHLTPPLKWIVPLIRPKFEIKHSAKVIDFHSALAEQNGDALDFEESADDRFCALFHTGGTTGRPKIVQHQQSGVLYNGWIGSTLLYKETDVVLCPLPLFHVFAAYPIWAGCLKSGAHMILPTPAGYRGDGVFDNMWQLIERWKVTFLVTVPTAAAALMQRPVNADVSSLSAAFCGSAPLPVELFKNFQKATGVEIIEGYGMSEATCLVSCNPTDGERRIGSVGFPFPHTDVRIYDCDAEGKVLAEMGVDEVGEICVSNPGVAIGQTYTEADKNTGLFANGTHLRTGDLGRIDAEGYLWITGRAKDLIIRGGHNIDPAVIEEALAGHPAVAFAAAIGQPDIKAGELPCAFVELVDGGEVTIDELMTYVGDHVHERAARPKYMEILPELPKTAVGKVFKPDLRKMAITRIYDQALTDAGLPVSVALVVETKKKGLVAMLQASGDASDEAVTAVLGGFIQGWEWAE